MRCTVHITNSNLTTALAFSYNTLGWVEKNKKSLRPSSIGPIFRRFKIDSYRYALRVRAQQIRELLFFFLIAGHL